MRKNFAREVAGIRAQDGLRIFAEDVLVEPLDGRTFDVKYAGGEPELVLR